MAARRSDLASAFETFSAASFGPTDTTLTVDSTTNGPGSPCCLVIEPDDPSQREYVYFDGTFTGTTFVTTSTANRHLAGSAASSGLTHPIGSVVRCSPLAQHFEDLNDRIDASLPVGSVLVFAGASSPDGFLLCDGASRLRTEHPASFGVIGTTCGAADSTHFNVPNLSGRVPVGLDSSQGEFDSLDARGGTKTVALAASEMPTHLHSNTASAIGTTDTFPNHSHSVSTSSASSSHSHTVNESGTAVVPSLGGQAVSTSTSPTWRVVNAGSPFQGVHFSNFGTHTHNVSIPSGGAHTHVVSQADTGSHSHSVSPTVTVNIAEAGGGSARSSLQPFIVLHFIIKA